MWCAFFKDLPGVANHAQVTIGAGLSLATLQALSAFSKVEVEWVPWAKIPEVACLGYEMEQLELPPPSNLLDPNDNRFDINLAYKIKTK